MIGAPRAIGPAKLHAPLKLAGPAAAVVLYELQVCVERQRLVVDVRIPRDPIGARERAEQVVERAVLLHHDHDVLDLVDAARCGPVDAARCGPVNAARRPQ